MASSSSSSSSSLSGMAAALRHCTTPAHASSEPFDCAGMSVSTIETVIRQAFGGGSGNDHPGDGKENDVARWPQPVRLTLITGAGKLARQKYDPQLAAVVTRVLRAECGYTEDPGASAIPECAGTYKLQHDTGKNLKTVVIFPKIVPAVAATDGSPGSTSDPAVAALLNPDTPGYKLAVASFTTTFPDMIRTKCPTWSQKKAAIAALDPYVARLESIDDQLLQGQVLTATQQTIYDDWSSTDDLQRKQAALREQMHHQVDAGKITKNEHALLMQQVQDRIEELQTQIAAQSGDTATKHRLDTQLLKARERKDKLASITPLATPPPLVHAAKITALQQELAPLQQAVTRFSSVGGKLLTLAESQQVARRDELVQDIERWEQASRGWFESDEDFGARLALSRKQAPGSRSAVPGKKGAMPSTAAGGSKKITATNMSATTTNWVTPSATKSNSASTTAAAQKKAPAVRGGGVFAAMMLNDDDDE